MRKHDFALAKILYIQERYALLRREDEVSRLNPDIRSRAGLGCLAVFAIFWLGFSLLWTFLSLQGGEGLQWLFGIPFILIGLFMLGQLIYRLMARLRVLQPEVDISSPSPQPGETFSISYRQAFRTAAHVERIGVELIFQESATYRRGTDTYTKKHEEIVDYFDNPARHFESGESFRDHYQFTIPKEGMHSFSGTNNKLFWLVRIKVEITNWPTYTEDFMLQVPARKGW